MNSENVKTLAVSAPTASDEPEGKTVVCAIAISEQPKRGCVYISVYDFDGKYVA
jgi:hypothetical protein